MAEELDREKPLFDARLPVEVRRPDLVERKEVLQLTLRVLTGTRPAPSGGQREKLLHIEVTDESDSFFLYTLDVGEEDFHELKRDQSLLVDFHAFPNKFIELISSCCTGREHHAPSTPAEPHFLARMDARGGSATGVFSIVEANQFKELTHLSLQCRPGNDTTIKMYLAGRLRQTMRERDRYAQALTTAEDRLKAEARARKELEMELHKASTGAEHKLSEMHASHISELAKQRESLVREMEEASQGYQKEIRDLQAAKDQATALLQKRLDESEARRMELSDLRHGQEASIRELTRKLEATEIATQEAEKEMKELRVLNRELESAKFSLEKESSKHQLRIAALEQQVMDREQLLSKSNELQNAAEKARVKVEESMELYKVSCVTLQEKLEASVAEINKGNQIIQRLQSEYKQLKSKLRLKGDVLKQQERLLMEREHALDDATRRMQQLTDEKSLVEEKLSRASKDLAAAYEKIEECNKLIDSNQQTITWFNKQLNEAHLRDAYTTPSTIATTFTPFYQGTTVGGTAKTPSFDDDILRRYTTPNTPPTTRRRYGGALDVLSGLDGGRPPVKSSVTSYA